MIFNYIAPPPRLWRAVWLACAALLLASTARAQTAADGFNPNVNGNVYAVAAQSDGKLIIGGSFTTVSGQPRINLARLNPDGSLDTTFNPGANNSVYVLVVQADDKIIVGGGFSVLGGQSRNSLARLNANGTLDNTFATAGVNAGGAVYCLALESMGKLVVGGQFDHLGGQIRNNVGRLNPDGTLDAGFNVNIAGGPDVRAIAIQPDGRMVLGGQFTSVNGQTRNCLARVNADGTLDTGFNPNVVGINNATFVLALALQADGRLLVGGFFMTIGGQPRANLARLNPNGSVDSGFVANISNYVYALALQTDGKIILGGVFNTVNGQTRGNLARLNPDGSLGNYSSGTDADVTALLVQADGKVVAGGAFNTLNGVARSSLGRLYPNGGLDDNFALNANNTVHAFAVQPDGAVVVGGDFTSLGILPLTRLGRVSASGTLDLNFNPAPNGSVYALAAQPDGKIIVGGVFDHITGQGRVRLARLNPNGSLDAAFAPEPNGPVYTIVLQADGKLLVGGAFTSIGGQGRQRLARLNADGSLDVSFNAAVGGAVYALALHTNGQIVVGGSFATLNGAAHPNLGRLNPDSSTDTSFNPAADGGVFALWRQSGTENLYVGGNFTTLNGQPRGYFGKLNNAGVLVAAPGGNLNGPLYSFAALGNDLVLGGNFTTVDGQPRQHLARLNQVNNGLVANWNPSADGLVNALAAQADGKLLAGGTFATLGGQARTNLGRLSATQGVVLKWSLFNNATQIGLFSIGDLPQIGHSTYEYSTDAVNYSLLGTGSAVPVAGLPVNQNLYLRFRGHYSTGEDNGSGSIFESVAQFYLASCTYTLTPASQNFAAAGGSGSVVLTTAYANCAWTVQSNAAWLTPALVSGTGNASLGFTVAANAGVQRTGTLTIAGQTFTITQAGAVACAYSIAPQTFTVGESAGGGFVTITTTAGCGWTTTSNEAWLTVTPPSGTGSGTASFTFTSSNHQQRTGTLNVAGQTVTINQSSGLPAGCGSLALNPAVLPNPQLNNAYSQTVTATGGNGPYSFALSSGALPNGLQLTANGQLSGTPTQSGAFTFSVAVIDSVACSKTISYTLTINPGPQPAKFKKGDFDGDGKADLAVWTGATGNWAALKSSTNAAYDIPWGAGYAPYNDVIVPGDYDGDGKLDHAIWRGADSLWYIRKSSDGQALLQLYGANYAPFFDVPVPGDFDGDGKTDIAVWRPQTGTWFVRRSSTNTDLIVQHGQDGDIPLAADFDGDGKCDFAVFRPSAIAPTPNWLILQSSNNAVTALQWGGGYAPYFDLPVPADYDGDGKTDLAIWRGQDSVWYIRPSANPNSPVLEFWGANYAPYFDIPVPTDYDGDGKADIAVWRKDGTWYVKRSSNGTSLIQVHGQQGDVPVPASGVR